MNIIRRFGKNIVKTLAALTAALLLFTLIPARAAERSEGSLVYYKQDFEGFDVSASPDDIFSDARGNKPAGMAEFIGNGANSGANISAGKIGGSKSLRLMRVDGGEGCIRIGGFSTHALPEGSKIYFTFSFRYTVLGNYGFTVLLSGIPASPSLEDYGGGSRNLFSANTDTSTGKDMLYVVAPDGDPNRILVTDGLKADTDNVLTTVFTVGSDDYELFLNGTSMGTYKYIGKMTCVNGIRIDCHDWVAECDISKAQPGDIHVNEVYFDDISLTADPAADQIDEQNKSYRFDGDDELFIEDWEVLETSDEFEQPEEGKPMFMYNGGLPFLAAEKTPFINPVSFVRASDGEGKIDGVTLLMKDFLDMRFWNTNITVEPDEAIYTWFEIRIDELTGYFDMCLTNAGEASDGPTDSTAQGGMVLRLRKGTDGKIDVLNSGYRTVASIEQGKVYKLGVVMEEESDRYRVFIDDKYVADSLSVYPAEFYGVVSIRFDLEGTGSVAALDNITLERGTLEEISAGDTEPTAVPATDVPTEAPATDAPTDVPATDAPTEVPATDAPTDVPPAETAAEAPTDNQNGSGDNTGDQEKKGPGALPWIIGGAVVAIGAIAGIFVAISKKKKK